MFSSALAHSEDVKQLSLCLHYREMHSNKFACEVPFVVSSTLTHLKKFFLLFVQTSELQNMKHTLPKKEDKKIQQGISHTIVHNIQY